MLGVNFGELTVDFGNVLCAKKSLEFGKGKFRFAAKNGKILHNVIIITFCKQKSYGVTKKFNMLQ